MAFKNYLFQNALRLVLLALNLYLIFWWQARYPFGFTTAFLIALLLGQLWAFLRYQYQLVAELRKFFEAVQYDDLSVRFELAQKGAAFAELEQGFQAFLQKRKEHLVHSKRQEDLLGMIVHYIPLGILVLDQQKRVLQHNPRFAELIDVPVYQDWQQLAKKLPSLAALVGDFDFQGRKLWLSPNNKEFSLELRRIQAGEESYYLLSMDAIGAAIEEREWEAWHQLIRTLAHEVMNSVTPVISLSETINSMVEDDQGCLVQVGDLEQSDLEDIHEALRTIIRRSKGMLSFVDDYRKLTQLPAPQPSLISVQDLLQDCAALMQADAQKKGATISVAAEPQSLAIRADRKMIEQVIINLVKNALAALKHNEPGEIKLLGSYSEQGPLLSVADNGEGIIPEHRSRIFVPFFTTRKNGTGIGLSLSRNIMRRHQGDLRVESVPGEGAVFKLCFCE